MNKNVKRIFFAVTILTLLVAVSAVSASDVSDDTPIADSLQDNVVSDTQEVASSDAIVTSNEVISEQTTSPTENNIADTKNIKKTTNELKTTTNTVTVNNYDELKNAITNAVNDPENEEYVINLNEGSYIITSNIILDSGTNTPNIIINANNQLLSASQVSRYIRFNNGCNVTINNAIITHRLQNYVNNFTLNNVTINETITNRADKTLTFINSTINCSISNKGNIILMIIQ